MSAPLVHDSTTTTKVAAVLGGTPASSSSSLLDHQQTTDALLTPPLFSYDEAQHTAATAFAQSPPPATSCSQAILPPHEKDVTATMRRLFHQCHGCEPMPLTTAMDTRTSPLSLSPPIVPPLHATPAKASVLTNVAPPPPPPPPQPTSPSWLTALGSVGAAAAGAMSATSFTSGCSGDTENGSCHNQGRIASSPLPSQSLSMFLPHSRSGGSTTTSFVSQEQQHKQPHQSGPEGRLLRGGEEFDLNSVLPVESWEPCFPCQQQHRPHSAYYSSCGNFLDDQHFSSPNTTPLGLDYSINNENSLRVLPATGGAGNSDDEFSAVAASKPLFHDHVRWPAASASASFGDTSGLDTGSVAIPGRLHEGSYSADGFSSLQKLQSAAGSVDEPFQNDTIGTTTNSTHGQEASSSSPTVSRTRAPLVKTADSGSLVPLGTPATTVTPSDDIRRPQHAGNNGSAGQSQQRATITTATSYNNSTPRLGSLDIAPAKQLGRKWDKPPLLRSKELLDSSLTGHKTSERTTWPLMSDVQLPLSVFVGNIPKNTSEEVLRKTMQLKGTVTDIFCEFRPGCWLTAFVTYSTFAEAARAVEFFNNKRAFKNSHHHRLVCCFAPPPPASLCCTSNTQSCLHETCQDTVEPKAALAPFFPKFSVQPGDQVTMSKAIPPPRFSLLKDGPAGANLFVYGIPSDWTEVTLMRLTQEFGHIVGIRVPSAPTSGPQRLNKGFGFVSYDSTESSVRAIEALSGRQFLGKPLNIQLKLGEHLNPCSATPASRQNGRSLVETITPGTPPAVTPQQRHKINLCNDAKSQRRVMAAACSKLEKKFPRDERSSQTQQQQQQQSPKKLPNSISMDLTVHGQQGDWAQKNEPNHVWGPLWTAENLSCPTSPTTVGSRSTCRPSVEDPKGAVVFRRTQKCRSKTTSDLFTDPLHSHRRTVSMVVKGHWLSDDDSAVSDMPSDLPNKSSSNTSGCSTNALVPNDLSTVDGASATTDTLPATLTNFGSEKWDNRWTPKSASFGDSFMGGWSGEPYLNRNAKSVDDWTNRILHSATDDLHDLSLPSTDSTNNHQGIWSLLAAEWNPHQRPPTDKSTASLPILSENGSSSPQSFPFTTETAQQHTSQDDLVALLQRLRVPHDDQHSATDDSTPYDIYPSTPTPMSSLFCTPIEQHLHLS